MNVDIVFLWGIESYLGKVLHSKAEVSSVDIWPIACLLMIVIPAPRRT